MKLVSKSSVGYSVVWFKGSLVGTYTKNIFYKNIVAEIFKIVRI